MAGKYVSREIKAGVCAITHERPPANFLSIESMLEFITALEEAEADPEVKVITIWGGGGKFFSAGVDVADHTEELAKTMTETFDRLLDALMYGDKPKIAVVKGLALGGGCEVIAYCDMVYASERAKFGQPEINVGVFPAPAAAIFPKLIGPKKSYELILTGDVISASEAERIGLINKVCADDELIDEVNKLTDKLCAKSSIVLQLTRKAIMKAKDVNLETGRKESMSIYDDELMKTEDAHIGIESFLAQKQPVWKNK